MKHFIVAALMLAAATAAQAKPNIVVIMADDDNVATYGQQHKAIDLIADEGVSFTRAYSATPVCAAGRAAFFTGLYGHNSGVIGNSNAWDVFEGLQNVSIHNRLRQEGYTTALFGKYMNKRVPTDPVKFWHHFVERGGYFGGTAYVNGEPVPLTSDTYVPDWLGEQATEWIIGQAGKPGPFFAVYAPFSPHTAQLPPPRYEDAPVVPFDPPPSFQGSLSEAREIWNGRVRTMMAVGDQIEALIAAVDAIGELDNTVFLYTTDHGWCLGEHGHVGKSAQWECANRIYLTMRGPGIPKGEVRNHLVSQVDIAPTLCHLAGCSVNGYDGKTLMRIVNDPNADWRSALFVEHERVFWSVRQGNLKYIDEKHGRERLYQLGTDPYELDDKAAEWGARLEDLRALATKLKTCSGGQCWE